MDISDSQSEPGYVLDDTTEETAAVGYVCFDVGNGHARMFPVLHVYTSS
jgi:hypothetical protein